MIISYYYSISSCVIGYYYHYDYYLFYHYYHLPGTFDTPGEVVSVKKTFLFGEPLPFNPSAELLSSPRFGPPKAYKLDSLLLRRSVFFTDTGTSGEVVLHSAKGGAVETGCSGLYDVMY